MDHDTEELIQSPQIPRPLLGVLTVSIATGIYLKQGKYTIAFRLYSNSGGGGFNIYKQAQNEKLRRCFAIDYHPFWNKNEKEHQWRLHYHRGETSSQMKKHRPYEGGW